MRHPFQLAVFCISFGLLLHPAKAEKPSIVAAPFATLPTGEIVQQFTIRNSHGMQVKVIEFGAIVTEISVPDRQGKFTNVVLGSDSLDAYLKGFPAAAVIGRFANRIREGRFTLDGKTIQLTKNAGENHIHGGQKHFGKLLWKGAKPESENDASVEMKYTSRDGEEGFPGTLQVSVTYTLSESNELKIQYRASTDQATIVNLTNHAYFNLSGALTDVLDHELQIESDQTTLVDKSLIPTGQLASVEATALDFRSPRRIGERIEQLYDAAKGYDHNYVLRGEHGTLRLAAKVSEPKTGRVMECLTTEPGVQLYTANGFNNNPFPKHGAFCLETQHYPDSPNHPEFPTVVVRPNVPWNSTTLFRFSVIPNEAKGYPPQLSEGKSYVYKSIDQTNLRLWAFSPAGHKPTDRRPAVVFFFGGGWQSGSPKQFEQHCRYLASRGIVALTADYRVASRHSVKVVDCVRDAKSAIRWARTHASELGIDSNRIAAGGGSAGGHLAACTATLKDFDEGSEDSAVSSKPNALVLFNPVVALDTLEGSPTPSDKQVASLQARLGVESRSLSPAHHIQADMPPTIVFFGTNDDLLLGAKFMERQMQKASCRIELVTYEGESHGFFNFGRGDNSKFRDTLLRTDQFLSSLGWLVGKPNVDSFDFP